VLLVVIGNNPGIGSSDDPEDGIIDPCDIGDIVMVHHLFLVLEVANFCDGYMIIGRCTFEPMKRRIDILSFIGI